MAHKSSSYFLALAAIPLFGVIPASAAPTNIHPGPSVEARAHDALGRYGKNIDQTALQLKLSDGGGLRLVRGHIVSDRAELAGAAQRLDRALTSSDVVSVTPYFGDIAGVEALMSSARRESGTPAPDLAAWLRLDVRPGTQASVLRSLIGLDGVDAVEPVPLAVPMVIPGRAAPASFTASAAEDLTKLQKYLRPAPEGVDADYANTIKGGTGKNVTTFDIEYSWNFKHEDLSKLRASDVWIPVKGTDKGRTEYDWHGTAVIGELAGDKNAFGITGGAYDTKVRVASDNPVKGTKGAPDANALIEVAKSAKSGDVVMLEAQMEGPKKCNKRELLIPVEWNKPTFDAVQALTKAGVHVVEAAGNGNGNLDDACFDGSFKRSHDSGAIIVGAGSAHQIMSGCGGMDGGNQARSRLGFSTYGARVDLQGWGECVTTSGGDPSKKNSYFKDFAGTSSATPIVCVAVTNVSSIYKEKGKKITPIELRSLLTKTGTPQPAGDKGHIGPQPDLKKALASVQ